MPSSSLMAIFIGAMIGLVAGGVTLAVTAWRARRHVEGSPSAWIGFIAPLGVVALGFAAAFPVGDEAAWAYSFSLVVTRLVALTIFRKTA